MAQAKVRGVGKFQKAKILSALKDTQTAVLVQLEDYDTKLARWREEAPAKFAEYVANYDPAKSGYWSHTWDPPTKGTACSDYRIQALNKHIAKVDAMGDNDGIVTILNSDPLWEYVGQAACI